MSQLYGLVQRMREDRTLSRNRSYDELSQPLARRARQIHKRLQGIERELRAGAAVKVFRRERGYMLRLEFPEVRVWREAHLTDEEYALLCGDPAVGVLLAKAE